VITAGMKLQKGSLGVSDTCDTPEKPKYAVEKSLNFIAEYLYEPCHILYQKIEGPSISHDLSFYNQLGVKQHCCPLGNHCYTIASTKTHLPANRHLDHLVMAMPWWGSCTMAKHLASQGVHEPHDLKCIARRSKCRCVCL